MLIDDPSRFNGVTVIGVDEHVAPHPSRRQVRHRDHRSDPVRAGPALARLLDMVEGRSKQAFKTWLAEREESWRQAVEVVAMDGFTGSRPPPARAA